jgi:hypothetical protein
MSSQGRPDEPFGRVRRSGRVLGPPAPRTHGDVRAGSIAARDVAPSNIGISGGFLAPVLG